MFSWNDKGTWKCPSCGASWIVESRSVQHCYQCGFEAKSFTVQVRAILARYHGAEVRFDLDLGRKGRRKMRPVPIVGTYQWLCHNPTNGFVMDVLVLRENGRRVRFRTRRIPLKQIKPWGPLLEKTIINLDLIVARNTLPEGIFHLPEKSEVAGG